MTNPPRFESKGRSSCTGFSPDTDRSFVEHGQVFVAGLAHLRNLTYIDLPTSHWPTWSRPADLADILGDIARHS